MALSQETTNKKKRAATSKQSTFKLASSSSFEKKPAKPLTSFLKPLPVEKKPVVPTKPAGKQKEKESAFPSSHDEASLWVDRYEPLTEEELAVHKKKVDDIRHWLGEAFGSGTLRKYRRILALTGPAGCGKTTTLRVLARELDFDLVEWNNTVDENFSTERSDRESLTQKFNTFLTRAASYSSVFSSEAQSAASSSQLPSQRLVLLEDLPNIMHPTVMQSFHAALLAYVELPAEDSCPLVIVVSDAGVRGEAPEDMLADSSYSSAPTAVSIRTVLPPALLHSPFVTQIGFNPVAPTRMRKALQALMARHFASKQQKKVSPSMEALDIVVASSNGDIRSAVMAMQFACIVDLPNGKIKGKRPKFLKDILEAVTRRENSLALFHLLGKILYNKRKGDPPNPSDSAKDIERQQETDKLIRDSPSLPGHMRQHERRASRVDIELLHADMPVDSSLLSLYLHHNYTQYCDSVEECAEFMERLSVFDSSARSEELWNRASPHQFHLLARGALHALPSPVPRRAQKLFKPEFFDVLKRTKEAESGVLAVRAWLVGDTLDDARLGGAESTTHAWGAREVAQELGGVLAARSLAGADPPPAMHTTFSVLQYAPVSASASQGRVKTRALEEDEKAGDDVGFEESFPSTQHAASALLHGARSLRNEHGWLDDDDIEEF